MEKTSEIYSLTAIGISAGWILILLYYRFVTDNQIRSMIVNYYGKQGIVVQYISKLTYAEKIQYGVPLNLIIRIYGIGFTMLKLGDHHFRKIEITGKNQKEQIKYIDLFIKKRNLIFCDEFKSFKF